MTTAPAFAITYPRPAPPPSPLQLQLAQMTADVDRVALQLRTALLPAIRKAGEQMHRLFTAMTAAYNTPEYVAGLVGRYYVRGGLDPAYAMPEQRDALARAILAGEEPALLFVNRTHRAEVAAAVLTGWAAHRPPSPLDWSGGLPWHRALGSTRVVVTRG